MKKSIKISIVVLCLVLFITNVNVFAQTSPTISSPVENSSYSRGNLTVTWAAVTGATYKISMRDTTVNMLVLSNETVGTATSYTVLSKYFYEGHNYRVAVSATVGSTTTWGQCNFKISLSSARNTMITRGNTMNSYTWTPTQNVRGWRNNKTFYAGTTYTGLPYSQTEYHCSISSVPWSYGSYFNNMLTSTTSGFYDDYTRFDIIMPKYGSDCSGYVSACWNISRHTTTSLVYSDHPLVGKSGETALKKYARMSPGDIFVNSGHTFMLESITAVNDASGNLSRLSFSCNEQTPYSCINSTWSSDTCNTNSYQAYVKDSTFAQDYSWDWK